MALRPARLILTVLVTVASVFVAGLSASSADEVEPGTVHGVVRDLGTGDSLRGARVTLEHEDGEEWSRTTRADGRFSFASITPGAYSLITSRSSHETDVQRIQVSDGEAYDVGFVDLSSTEEWTSTFSGSVVDSAGDPVEDIRVQALRMDEDGDSSVASTAITYGGEFDLFVTAGSYVITFDDVNERFDDVAYADGEPQVIGDGQAIDLSSTTLGRRVSFTASGTVSNVRDAGTGAEVTLYHLTEGEWRPHTDEYTNRNGEYYFRNLRAGWTYTVSAHAPGRARVFLGGARSADEATPFDGSDGDLTLPDIALQPASTLSGTVTVEGEPVRGYAYLHEWVANEDDSFELRYREAAPVGDDGRYLLTPRSAGRYTVEFYPDDYSLEPVWLDHGVEYPEHPDDSSVTFGDDVVDLVRDIQLRPSEVIRGRVLAADGTGLPGARVRAFTYDDYGHGYEGFYGPTADVVADATGAFTIRVRRGQTYTLKFSKQGYRGVYLGGSPYRPKNLSDERTFIRAADDLPDITSPRLQLDDRPGRITGYVVDEEYEGIAASLVEACRVVGDVQQRCTTTRTSANGRYVADGLPAGEYVVKANPPGGRDLFADSVRVAVTPGASRNVNITLKPPLRLPEQTSITSIGSSGGLPVVNYQQDLVLKVPGCSIAALGSGTWKVTFTDGGAPRTGTLAPTADGRLTGTIPRLFPHTGQAVISTTRTCPGMSQTQGPGFNLYIDPSGTVVDQFGAPVVGATVSLQRSNTDGGTYVQVPNGSDVMSPSNRKNPDTTDAAGFFRWDVTAGFYRVKVAASGCSETTTPSMEVPPERIDLVIKLQCDRPAPGGVTPPNVRGTPKVGSTLGLDDATAPSGYSTVGTPQWLRDGAPIQGATARSYVVTPDDLGKGISVRQSVQRAPVASNIGGETVTFAPFTTESARQTVTAGDGPAATARPVITGTMKVGSTVSATTGTWSPAAGLDFTYQWRVAGAAIPGATSQRFVLRPQDAAKAVTVTVAASRPGHGSASSTSAARSVPKQTASVKTKLKKAKIKASQRGSVTVTVKATGFARPTGKVTLLVGKKKVGSGTLKTSGKGKVVIKVAKLKKGSHKIVASYGGTGQIAARKASSVTLKVTK